MLFSHLQYARCPMPEREYRFAAPRRWKFDFAYVPQKVAIEVEGGTMSGGRHTRGIGYENDCVKYNTATLLGWRVIRFTAAMVKDGRALATVEECVETWILPTK